MTENAPDTRQYEGYADRKTRSSNVKKIVLLAVLLLLLALVLYSIYYFVNNRRLPIPRVTTDRTAEVAPPEYLYSISGPQGTDALTRPVGVAVTRDDLVFATDTEAGVVRVYTVDGRYRFTITEELQAPAHVAVGPDGNIYVSDRRKRGIQVFQPDGTFIRSIKPTGEDGETWSPLGMAFDAEGNVYATDVGQTQNHRVIGFTPEGVEIRRFGATAQANQMSDEPVRFYFPNGIWFADDGRLFVGDSNNRRVQVFAPDGTFEYFIRTSGIPRGIVIDEQDRLYVVDALAHMVDIYTLEGERIVSFGSNGVGPGQFRYANDVALDREGRIFVSDRENHQIQVWAWAEDEIVLPPGPKTAGQWALCLSPLLLLPLLFFFRRKRFVVTEDFVDEMVALEAVAEMDRRRWRWIAPEHVWPAFRGRVEGDVDLGHLIHERAHSESDAKELERRMDIGYEDAVLLVVAQRAKRLCTEDERITGLAHQLEIDVFDARRWRERFAKKDGRARESKG